MQQQLPAILSASTTHACSRTAKSPHCVQQQQQQVHADSSMNCEKQKQRQWSHSCCLPRKSLWQNPFSIIKYWHICVSAALVCVFTRWCLEMYKKHYSGSFQQDPSKLYTRQEMLVIFTVSEMNIDGRKASKINASMFVE